MSGAQWTADVRNMRVSRPDPAGRVGRSNVIGVDVSDAGTLVMAYDDADEGVGATRSAYVEEWVPATDLVASWPETMFEVGADADVRVSVRARFATPNIAEGVHTGSDIVYATASPLPAGLALGGDGLITGRTAATGLFEIDLVAAAAGTGDVVGQATVTLEVAVAE